MRTRSLPSLLAVSFLLLPACAGPQKPSTEEAKPSVEEAVPSLEAEAGAAASAEPTELLPNGKQIGDDLLIGGQPTPEQLEALKAAGYRTVISLQSESEEGAETVLAVARNTFGAGAVHLPVPGVLGVDEDNAAKLHEALKTARERGGKIVIHCRTGGRASALYALARYRHEGVSAEAAMAEAKAAGLTKEALIEHLGELLQEPVS
ncbi:MAG: sulfur transferase domain-containing protein [Deltaproteobacteria bacterium]|nr:sulfur transferase domain-containing protein [Deltaproteobacteria bacterium]